MSGSTHSAVGAATALLICQPINVIDISFCIISGAIGGLACDIDTEKSKGANLFRKSFPVLISFLFIAYSSVASKGSLWNFITVRTLLGIVSFLVLYSIAYKTDHRTFSHSFEFIILNTILLYVLELPYLVSASYLIGMVMHIAFDLLNKKKVTLSVLFKIRWCANLVPANGTTNKVIGTVADAIIAFGVVFAVL